MTDRKAFVVEIFIRGNWEHRYDGDCEANAWWCWHDWCHCLDCPVRLVRTADNEVIYERGQIVGAA